MGNSIEKHHSCLFSCITVNWSVLITKESRLRKYPILAIKNKTKNKQQTRKTEKQKIKHFKDEQTTVINV